MLNWKWLPGVRDCLGKLRRRRRHSLLAFSERLENRSLLTTIALMTTELPAVDTPQDCESGSQDWLTADSSVTGEISAPPVDAPANFDPLSLPDSFFQTIRPAAAGGPVTESGPGNLHEHHDHFRDPDDSRHAVPDHQQIHFLFRAENVAALHADDVPLPGLLPASVSTPDAPPLTLTDNLTDETVEEDDLQDGDDTAFPMTSVEPLRINLRHTRLIETLRQQARSEHSARDIRMEHPLAVPEAVSKPDILLSPSQHLAEPSQTDSGKTETPALDGVSVTAEDSSEQSGKRIVRTDPEVPDRSDRRRENVINSLFENRAGKSGTVQQTAGEKTAAARPEEIQAPPRVKPVPLTADGELLLKPGRPVAPPLPEPAEDGSTSALDPVVSPVASAAVFATVPAGWRARLRRRLRYWQAVLA